MAETLGGLWLSMGLDLAELETGFINAERTIAANIGKLNREANLVRIRSEIEIAGLDEVADAERILQIRQEALNQQLAIQRDRVRILDAELQNIIQTQGENSVAAQRATVTLERQRLVLANLERELRNLTEAQEESNENLGGLSDLTAKLSPRLQAVAKVFDTMKQTIEAVGGSVKELVSEFRELQNQSYELNMPFDKTKKFLRELKLAGGDIGDFEGYVRGITDAFVKGEADDPEFITLRKYDAVITDTNGRLKDFLDITEEVYKAWLKASEAGEGIEFLQLTGGESGIRDAIQFFERYPEAIRDAAKIIDAKINEKQLHNLERTFNLIEEQSKELKSALADIFVPAAQTAAEKFFQTLKDGTQYLVENKDEFQRWGFIASETFETIEEKLKSIQASANAKISEILNANKSTGNKAVDDLLSGGMAWRYGGGANKNPFGVDNMTAGFNPNIKKPASLWDGIIERATEKHKAYNAELDKTAKKIQEVADKNPLNQYAIQRIQKFRDELEDLRIDLDFDDEFEQARQHLKLELNRELDRKNFLSTDEESAIRALIAAKLEAVDKAEAKAFEEINNRIKAHFANAADIEFNLTHSVFEKQLRDIERWKEAMEEKAESAEETASIITEAAAKEAEAFEREMDRIKGKLQSLDDKIFEIDHSRYENDLRRIQQDYIKEAQEWIDAGLWTSEIKGKLDYLYSRQKSDLDKRANESRAKGDDYTKRPEGASNGIWSDVGLIYGDQIISDGLKNLQANFSAISDERNLRSQLLPYLSQEAQKTVEMIDAQKAFVAETQNLAASFPQLNAAFSPTMQKFPQATVGGATMIQGDTVTQISLDDLQKEIENSLKERGEFETVMSQLGLLDMSQPAQPVLPEINVPEINFPTEVIVTPLEKISGIVEKILSAVNNREPPQINIESNPAINLGGAYVFDESMKKSLVDDITSTVANAVKDAVQQGVSKSNYGFGN